MSASHGAPGPLAWTPCNLDHAHDSPHGGCEVAGAALASAQARAAEMERTLAKVRSLADGIMLGAHIGLDTVKVALTALLSPSPSARPAAEEPESQGAAKDPVASEWLRRALKESREDLAALPAFLRGPAPSTTDGACKTCGGKGELHLWSPVRGELWQPCPACRSPEGK